jgi:quercetin dioxygenase-like cupin family protein
MSKAGDVIENPVTGERVVIRIGTEETGGELLVVDLYVQPGGAVMGEHVHSGIEERFTVLRGQVGFRLSGREAVAALGEKLIAPAGMPHDWWNAGPEEALVRIEIRPAARFEAMILNAFGLAQEGKVNRKGMPNLLQLAVFAREFDDVIRFTHPPRVVQRVLFGLLAPIARLLGYKGIYPEYIARGPTGFVEVEPLDIAAALADHRTPPSAEHQGAGGSSSGCDGS